MDVGQAVTRKEAILEGHRLVENSGRPAAIFECRHGISVQSADREAPSDPDKKLVMVVSVTGLERAYDPDWVRK